MKKDFTIGDVPFELVNNRRTQFRVSKLRLAPDQLSELPAIFDFVAALNVHRASKHLTGEDIYAMLGEVSEKEAEEAEQIIIAAFTETIQETKEKVAKKRASRKRSSGRSAGKR